MELPASSRHEHPLLAGYRPVPGVADELLDADGRMRPGWQPFVDQFLALPTSEIRERFERGNQYLRDAGVYFRQYSNDPLAEREWPLSHIPVVLNEPEWNSICAGLTQRAELLERVMADLYGDRRLVSDGYLPAELVAGNREWLRPMVGVAPKGGHYLHFLAFEIGRSPDGSWLVLGDRTQAPSGAGFALENRLATGRIFPEKFPRNYIHRLANFFIDYRHALERLALSAEGMPREAGILSPGPANDTYYEQTYIARYLGLMLLEGEDLLVQNAQAMVRTIEGPQPLGVLWRRMDSGFADPLELDPNSHIGTPGLVEAVRAGNLAMVNALGSGILETRAFMAFLPRINRVLTGQPLQIPNIATWWTGSPTERAYVRDNAERMIISPAMARDLPFDVDATTVHGDGLSGPAREAIADWLEREGNTLVGQEAVTLSTTPAWVDTPEGGAIHPCPMTIRVFAARTDQGWTFMKGGYARIGPEGDATALAMQRGGSVADVWVVSDKPVRPVSISAPQNAEYHRGQEHALPSRAADNLFWLGRYVERCEDAIRLIRAYHLRLAATGDPEDARLRLLSQFLRTYGFSMADPVPEALLIRLDAAFGCASKVRDRFSNDGWNALKDLGRTAREMTRTARPGDDTARAMGVLLRKITGFSGLVHENMYRTAGWRFLSIGRALERADGLAAMLATFASKTAPSGSLDLAIEVADSVNAHRRHHSIESNRATVVDLLALDAENPRAILFQIDELIRLVRALPGADEGGRPNALLRALLPLQTALAVADPETIDATRIQDYRARIAVISDLVATAYLR